MSENDVKTIEKVLAGDAEAYSQIAEKYAPSLAAVAYSRTFDREAARDVAQDALVEAYKNLRKLEKKENFSSWLYNITRNKAVSWLRRKGAEKRAFENVQMREAKKEQHTPSQLAERKEVTGNVMAAVQELPEDYREILLLRYYSGIGREKAALMLGISLDAADKRLQRALAKVRAKVGALSGLT